jgi:proline iminopeptidase
MERFPDLERYDEGMLAVGDGHRLSWEVGGNPHGKPAVVLHGGPGSGRFPAARNMFDPSVYQVVQFDQRNCGRSTPHASEPVVDLSTNTTAHLVADCELLREHLGIDRWLVWGGSWGSTLALAYAEAHPERVTEVILVSVGTTTEREVDWVTRSMGRVFPEQWARFRDALPEEHRHGNLAAAYSSRLHHADPHVRENAARAWCEWEDTHVATYAGYQPDPRYDDPAFRMCFARLVTHYWSNAAFVPDGHLLRDASLLDGIPGVLINGRLDISSPPDTAWALTRRWPGSELVLVDNAGHGSGHPSTRQAIRAAVERFAAPRSTS